MTRTRAVRLLTLSMLKPHGRCRSQVGYTTEPSVEALDVFASIGLTFALSREALCVERMDGLVMKETLIIPQGK